MSAEDDEPKLESTDGIQPHPADATVEPPVEVAEVEEVDGESPEKEEEGSCDQSSQPLGLPQ